MPDAFCYYEVDSALAYPADQFVAELAGEAVYLAAAGADRVTFEPGLLNALNQAQTVAWLLDGRIDEYDLVVEPDATRTRIAGRNAMAAAIDRHVRYRFLRAPRAAVIDTTGADSTITEMEGTFTAAQIAQILGGAIGLTIVWQARDYTLREDVDAVGPVLDVLQRLAQPWSLFEPFKVDVLVENGTCFVRARPGFSIPTDYALTATASRCRVLQSRRRTLPVWGRVTLTGATTNSSTTITDPENPTDPGTPMIGGEEDVTSDEVANDPASGVTVGRTVKTETYRTPDRLLLRSSTREYGLDRTSGTLQPVSEELTINTWEASVYGPRGPVNQPKTTRQFTQTKKRADVQVRARAEIGSGTGQVNYTATTAGTTGNAASVQQVQDAGASGVTVGVSGSSVTVTFPPGTSASAVAGAVNSSGAASALVVASASGTGAASAAPSTFLSGGGVQVGGLQLTRQEVVTYSYDAKKFLRTQVRQLDVFDQSASTWKPTELEIQNWIDKGRHLLEHRTLNYTLATKTSASGATTSEWVLTRRHVASAGGFPPGGIQPPLAQHANINVLTAGGATTTTLKVEETLSTDPDAVPLVYTNPNLNLADLRYILEQARACSGAIEREQRLDGPALVVLKKGKGLALTALTGADGTTPIPLPVMLLSEVHLRYDESSDEPEMTAATRGLGWEAA